MARNEATRSGAKEQSQPKIWWSNVVFFTLVHIGAVIGIYYMPLWSIKRSTLLLWFLTWQLSDFGCVKKPHSEPRLTSRLQHHRRLPSIIFSQSFSRHIGRTHNAGYPGIFSVPGFNQGGYHGRTNNVTIDGRPFEVVVSAIRTLIYFRRIHINDFPTP